MDLASKKAQRSALLLKLYELTDGDTMTDLPPDDVMAALGWEKAAFDPALAFLVSEDLAHWPVFGAIGLTHHGVRQAEQAIETRDVPTPLPVAAAHYGDAMTLRMPRAEAESHLDEQIAAGNELLAREPQTNAEMAEVARARDKWENVVVALLKAVYGDDSEPLIRWCNRINNMSDDYDNAYISDQAFDPREIQRGQTQSLVDILDSLKAELRYVPEPAASPTPAGISAAVPTKAFIVHGRDPANLREVMARMIDTATSLDAVILDEQLNRGRTIIDKFRAHATPACVAIVIMTGDDAGRLAANPKDNLDPRPRQNVVLELGYFLALLPPERVIVLREHGVVGPSDVDGVVYYSLDDTGWRHKLARELTGLGVTVDFTKIP